LNRLLSTEKPSRIFAIAEGTMATLIWASSFVLVKIGLAQIGPLTLAGLRYFLAALLLLPFALRHTDDLRSLPRGVWFRLFLLGLSAYTLGNGAMFWAMKYLQATTASFLMNFIPLLVLFSSILWLKEIPTRVQVIGVIVALIGSAIFFSLGVGKSTLLGIGILAFGCLGFTAFSILGREIAREQQTDTLTLTTLPLAFGGGLLLAIALPLEGLPTFSPLILGMVLWLALVNTALAYLLYNHSLQVLTALEMNMLLNLSPLGTAGLAWLFLGEGLTLAQAIGIVIVILGVSLVQRRG
jgi:drug/metabolite transporter (DMT)-like permease